MLYVFYGLVVLGCLAAIANVFILIYLMRFLISTKVQATAQLREFFADLTKVMATFFAEMEATKVEPVPVPPPKLPFWMAPKTEEVRKKTWDELYLEEELERERRRRIDSGLTDPDNVGGNWGIPPAPNPEAQEGLNVRNTLSKLEQ